MASLNSANRLAASVAAGTLLTPVTLAPGRAKLATRPDSTALPHTQTIGMVLVACLAAMATWVDATAMMSTWSCTNSATTSR